MKIANILPLVFIALSLTFAYGQEKPGGKIDINAKGGKDVKNLKGSKIIDDSTRQIYGPKTTKIFKELDLHTGSQKFNYVDTSIINLHFSFDPIVRKSNYLIADLGMIGTPFRYLFPKFESDIGMRTGLDWHESYFPSLHELDYYDTKSPHSWFTIFWGSGGRGKTNVGYSRNISERWNISFHYNGYFIDKLVGKQIRGDRNVESIYYDLSTSYRNKKNNYLLLASAQRLKHKVSEMGGVEYNPHFEIPDDIMFDVQGNPWFNKVNNDFSRNRFHVYQRLQFKPFFSFYNTLEIGRSKNELITKTSNESSYHFNYTEFDPPDSLNNKTIFRYMTDKAGIAGYTKNIFYDVYYKIRKIGLDYTYADPDTLNLIGNNWEHYGGFKVGIRFDSLINLDFNGEYLVNGGYSISGQLSSKWIDASVGRTERNPSLMYQFYRSPYDYWENENFEKVKYNTLEGTAKFKFKSFGFYPLIKIVGIGNNTYFDYVTDVDTLQQVVPAQETNDVGVFSFGGSSEFDLSKKVKLSAKYIRSTSIGSSARSIQIPEEFIYGKFSYMNRLFNDNMEVHTGVEVQWNSSYYGHGYDPLLGSYFIQTNYLVPDYWKINVFLNAKVNRGRFFLVAGNVLSPLLGHSYTAAPGYPGIGFYFDFGFNWQFYD